MEKEVNLLLGKYGSFRAVATALGVTPQHLSRIRNNRQNPSRKLREKIAKESVSDGRLWDVNHPIYRQAIIDARDYLDSLLSANQTRQARIEAIASYKKVLKMEAELKSSKEKAE